MRYLDAISIAGANFIDLYWILVSAVSLLSRFGVAKLFVFRAGQKRHRRCHESCKIDLSYNIGSKIWHRIDTQIVSTLVVSDSYSIRQLLQQLIPGKVQRLGFLPSKQEAGVCLRLLIIVIQKIILIVHEQVRLPPSVTLWCQFLVWSSFVCCGGMYVEGFLVVGN
jgi:hypothetical protein